MLTEAWNADSGDYVLPKSVPSDPTSVSLPEDERDLLAAPGGEFLLGLSVHPVSLPFHYPWSTLPNGEGVIDGFAYRASPFELHLLQDPYNSWFVRARRRGTSSTVPNSYWWSSGLEGIDWCPGLLVCDTSRRYSLPDLRLAAVAGTEWADNDHRIFCGLMDCGVHDQLVADAFRLLNDLTGPGVAGWPFGESALQLSVLVWLRATDSLPEVMLLTQTGRPGHRRGWFDRRLLSPDPSSLALWELPPGKWDIRPAMRAFYKATLLADEGMPDLALVAAIACLESASSFVLQLLLGGRDAAERKLEGTRFLDRFDRVLPELGVRVPDAEFARLRRAYFDRNGTVHGLRSIGSRKVAEHLSAVSDTLVYLWENVPLHAPKG